MSSATGPLDVAGLHVAVEALAARDAGLGREILLDVGRILSARLRAAGDANLGWTG
jgi:hypothetical protein